MNDDNDWETKWEVDGIEDPPKKESKGEGSGKMDSFGAGMLAQIMEYGSKQSAESHAKTQKLHDHTTKIALETAKVSSDIQTAVKAVQEAAKSAMQAVEEARRLAQSVAEGASKTSSIVMEATSSAQKQKDHVSGRIDGVVKQLAGIEARFVKIESMLSAKAVEKPMATPSAPMTVTNNMDGLRDLIEANQKAFSEVVAELKAPKRVVRDRNGYVTGIESGRSKS